MTKMELQNTSTKIDKQIFVILNKKVEIYEKNYNIYNNSTLF